ncbi:circularly permuted type 2 ATP-grasp protein [Tepidimicrobium xylanilyticum]|uniref:Glutathionylspermidine synthase preATP-grasp n=1 Tax=Tepidimicrobium xylanilyticum TaxID=1123352 RepID=A0A1H3AX35_9FIRM|nr:circularly permuted type 2 ATP-grasp protein [Tepidimicrobium xylanilyticum]SDX33369.1 Glutathionylspermidine synthase preATP-grasp [Tepidimicrobium xylanilyticum]
MDGLSVTKEYIDIIKRHPEKYYKDYLRTVEEVAKSNAKYKGKPIPFLYQPMFFTEEDIERFKNLTMLITSITNKVTNKYLESPQYRRKFKYPKLLEELILNNPGYDINVPIGRFDLFYGGDEFKFIEINTDGTSGMNEDNIFSNILLESQSMKIMKERYDISYFELVDSWVEESLRIYDKFSKKVDKPNIAIVDFIESGITAEFETFKKAYIKKGYNAVIADPKDLKYIDGKLYYEDMRIDLIYRRIVTAEFIEKADEIPDLIQAYKDGVVCSIGSLRSQIMHNKIIFKILHDEETLEFLSEEERNLIKNHVPFTEEFGGDDRVFNRVLMNKDRYIIKPIDSYASQGVHAGRDYTQEEWEEILKDSWNKDYLFQEFIAPYTRPFVQFEDGELKVRDFKLNIGVYMYNGKFAGAYTRISRENIIFGREGYFSIPSMLVKEKAL